MKWMRVSFVFLFAIVLVACGDQPANHPHKSKKNSENVRYTSFAEPPKTLDPARSYTVSEAIFIDQIYEPPLQYHYLKRPYQLIPLTAKEKPTVTYLDTKGNVLPMNAPSDKIAYSRYDIKIKPDIYYQPHPAFATKTDGSYHYHQLSTKDLYNIRQLKDFKHTGTRELTANDYVYQIKRLAHPSVSSPILGLMGNYILGLSDYAKKLQHIKKKKNTYIDLNHYPLAGAKVIDRYHYRIVINGKYPQFIYWLAMHFFAPIPWEADYFYSQPGMKERNLGFDWFPVGTGPYMLSENNPNQQMVLKKNPNFHGEYYPSQGEKSDKAKYLLDDAGKPLPFVDKVIFALEKETIPRWNKFLQGYYDSSTISSDNFDQAIKMDAQGKPNLSDDMKAKNIRLQTSIEPGIFFMGFNMLDNVVGGNSERAKKLRQAIAIAVDYEEFISIFLNGRGIPAQGPIPPGIFGYITGAAGINPYVYEWRDNKAKRKSIATAKKLLQQAGYPNGRDVKTGKPLILNYDVAATGGPDDKAIYDWMRKQFAKLGIQLNVRSTLYNRFQEKMRAGNAQIFSWGWLADYPDPENFFFLLYGPNSKVKYGGENATNYSNPKFDALFNKMKNTPNGPERQKIIKQMLEIIRKNTPWVWGYHRQEFILSHAWNRITKAHGVANNTLKYQRLDPQLREKKRQEWNQPILWPLIIFVVLLIAIILPVIIFHLRRERRSNIKRIATQQEN